jgi:putative phage-type endonuclease
MLDMEVDAILDLMNEYIENNQASLPQEWFLSDMLHNVSSVIEEQFGELPDEMYVYALLLCTTGRTSYLLPPLEGVSETLTQLRSIPQPDQRSLEWHAFRHKLITASVAYKALGTEASIRELVKTKQQPHVMYEDTNFEGPRHWGVKYEPLSIQYYESVYDTQIEGFGCILHPHHTFLAASPDGINVKESSPLYGRLLEIKNPFSRVITGNPKKEYWVQCQLQMEVCNLGACDFLETRFTEYESEEAFRADGTFQRSEDGKYKGIFLQVYQDGVVYLYPPFQCTEEEFNQWVADKITDTWINTVYWKLDDVSTTLIVRQPKWFESVVPQFEQVYHQINT